MHLSYSGDVRPGQFFEVSIPKYGEAPISVSGIGENFVDLTILRVGKVTDEVFERYVGNTLFLRGPYGNGFDLENYKNCELVVIAGGTGLSPAKGIVDYFADHPHEINGMTLVAGFKSTKDILFPEDFARWKKVMEVILTVDSAEDNTLCQIGLVTEYIPKLRLQDKSKAVAVVVSLPVSEIVFVHMGVMTQQFLQNELKKLYFPVCLIDSDDFYCSLWSVLDSLAHHFTYGELFS